MKKIILSENLSIKKLNPNNPLDTGLIEELEKDEEINGPTGYLWPLSTNLRDRKSLQNNDLLKSSYAIYLEKNPIGFLEISDIFKTPNMYSVDLAYALHKSARKKGYMKKVLTEVSTLLFEEYIEIDAITLMIDPRNKNSRNTASKAGFKTDGRLEAEYVEEGCVVYQKRRK